MICCSSGIEALTREKLQKDIGLSVEPPKDSLFIDVGDLRIRYSDTGNKLGAETLVLIHGFAGCLETWMLIQPLLDKYRVVALDLVGDGFSEKPLDWPYTFRAQGIIVASFIAKLGLNSVIVVGHSSGGIVAAQAANRSSRVVGAVMVAPGFFQYKPAFLSYSSCAPFVNFAARQLIKGRERSLRSLHRKDFFEMNPDMLEALLMPSRIPYAKESIAACMKSQEPPYQEVLSNIRVPIHFVWAANDAINPHVEGRISAITGSSAKISQTIVPDCAHYIQHEQPAALAKEISNFATRVVDK